MLVLLLYHYYFRLAHPLLCEYEDSHFDSDDESALLSIFQNDNVENDANSQNDTYSQNSVSLLPKIFEGSIEQINPLPNQKVIVLSKLGVRVLIEKKMPNNTSSKKYTAASNKTNARYGSELISLCRNICNFKGKNINTILPAFLVHTNDGYNFISEALKLIALTNRSKSMLVDALNMSVASKLGQLFALDNSMVSDGQWNMIRGACGLQSFLYEKSALQELRTALNKEVIEAFEMKQICEEGVSYVNIKAVIANILKEDALLTKQVVKRPKFKLTVDAGQGDMVILLTPLWGHENRHIQSPKNSYLIACYPCKSDNKEEILSKFDLVFEEIAGCIAAKEFDIDIEFLHISDLKAYWQLCDMPSNEFCPLCKKKNNHSSCYSDCTKNSKTCKYSLQCFDKAPARPIIKDKFGLTQYQFGICSMHCMQRITERLIDIIASTIRHDVVQKSLQQGVPQCRFFHFKTKDNKSITIDNAQDKFECPMLKGDVCIAILSDLTWLSIIDTGLRYMTLFRLWGWIVFCVLLANEEILKKYEPLREAVVFNFINLFVTTTGLSPTFYMHFLKDHLNELLEIQQLSFAATNNQGCEHSHLHRATLKCRECNNGGGKQCSLPIINDNLAQIMLRQYRLLLLQIKCLQSNDNLAVNYFLKIEQQKYKCTTTLINAEKLAELNYIATIEEQL